MNSFNTLLGLLKVLVTLFDAALVVFFVWVLSEALSVRPHLTPRRAAPPTFTAQRLAIQEAWQAILKTFGTGTPADTKVAIINADKLIDTMLKNAGFEGDSMVDRLKQIPSARVATLDRLYRAHRVRNNIVHTPDFSVSSQVGRQTMEDYEAFLKELKYIE